MKKKHTSDQHRKSIGSPCYMDSYPNQYSSLPAKEERRKVKRQSSINGISEANVKLLSNIHGSIPKSNNTPKVLCASFIENDTTMKRNSHGLNNSRPVHCIDEDKF